MKVRLIRGPFAGKVMSIPDHDYGRNTIQITGVKKMTRKQKEQMWRDFYTTSAPDWRDPTSIASGPRGQIVAADYNLVMVPNPMYARSLNYPTTYTTSSVNYTIPSVHPDGSIFYEYVRTI